MMSLEGGLDYNLVQLHDVTEIKIWNSALSNSIVSLERRLEYSFDLVHYVTGRKIGMECCPTALCHWKEDWNTVLSKCIMSLERSVTQIFAWLDFFL